MIKAIGNDIVDLERIAEVLKKGDLATRVLTANELEVFNQGKKRSLSFLGGRWAAKEAVAKALGCGISEHCSFQDINVFNDALGKPEVELSGKALERFNLLGAKSIFVSISHEQKYAIATVILEG